MSVDLDWLSQQGADAVLLRPVYAAFANVSHSLAVAVSGGGDSVALLHLADRVARHRGQALSAVTVDHGLRPEAAAEAAGVAAFCAVLGIPHQTLRWDGTAAKGNIMAAARAARYQLIADWALGQGMDHVLVGHTADDEAETVLLQLGRGAGVDGLAGLDPSMQRYGVKWSRPLWQTRRDDLRDYLTRHGVAWVDDPTNDDTRYLRPRLRAARPDLDDLGLSVEALTQVAFAQKMAKAALDHYTRQEVDRHVVFDFGDALLPQNLALPQEIERRIWRSILGWVGGGPYAPRQSALDSLANSVRAGVDHTVHGCRITVRQGRVRVTREWNAVRDLACGTQDLWDRRWRLEGPHDRRLCVRALGADGLAQSPEWRASGQPRPTLLASPAVWQNDRLVAAPLAGFGSDWSVKLIEPHTT